MNMATNTAIKILTLSVFLAITTALSDDEIAQAACAAISPSGFVSAVRRACNGKKNPSCNTICKNAVCSMRTLYGNQGTTSGTCFQTFHIYGDRNALKDSDVGRPIMAMAKYDISACKSTNCGPNFCCCRA